MSERMSYKKPSEALGATATNQNSKSFEKGSNVSNVDDCGE
jgi:hypothetical protein